MNVFFFLLLSGKGVFHCSVFAIFYFAFIDEIMGVGYKVHIFLCFALLLLQNEFYDD